MTKHKKPKVGDTVEWAVYDIDTKCILDGYPTRKAVRETVSRWNGEAKKRSPYRVARIVLDK